MANLTGIASTNAERIAMIAISVCGMLSGISTAGLLAYLLWSAYGPRFSRTQNGFRRFLRTDAGRYLTSLLVADLCHAAAYMSGLHWVWKREVALGGACTFQAVFLQLGDMGTVIWIFFIGIHTFMHLFLSTRPSAWLCPTALVLGWSIDILLPIVGKLAIERAGEPFFDGESGLWCWVSDSYSTTQTLFFFVWAMCALGISVICYTLVYLRTAGIIGIWGVAPPMERGRCAKRHWTCINAFGHTSDDATDSGPPSGSGGGGGGLVGRKPHKPSSTTTGGSNTRNVARKLLLYPVAYAIVVLPLTVSSLLDMTGAGAPFWLLVASTCVYALGGVVDTLVFLVTRRSFIRSATSESSRSHSRRRPVTGTAPERHRLEGITVTRHELTVIDIGDLDAMSDPGKARSFIQVQDDPPTPSPKDIVHSPFGSIYAELAKHEPDAGWADGHAY